MKRIMSWLKGLFGCSGSGERRVGKREKVTCDELSQILNSKPKRMANGDYTWDRKSLDVHIKWQEATGCENSRGGIDVVLVHVRDLDIEFDSGSDNFVRFDNLATGDIEIKYGGGLSFGNKMDLHFENCRFYSDDIWASGVKFVPEFEDHEVPYLADHLFWGKRFTFSNCTDRCTNPGEYNGASEFSFSFPGNSEVVFNRNDFERIVVRRNRGEKKGRMDLCFRRNTFDRLNLDFCFPLVYQVICSFHGNKIGVLSWDRMIERGEYGGEDEDRIVRYDDVQEYNLLRIYFGRDEIKDGDVEFFVRLKKLAIERKNAHEEKVIDSYLSAIRYTALKRIRWYKTVERAEDFLTLWWRWWSSRFYMSWARPLGLLVGGYFILNAIPMLWVDGYGHWGWSGYFILNGIPLFWVDFSEWLKFSFSGPKAISDLAKGLGGVLGTEVKGWDKFGLNLVEWARWIWIALCGVAFRNAIKKK